MPDVDLVVIGSGNAGQSVAGAARDEGRSVALVERGDLGGTCPIRGCVPKKVLVAAAEALDTIGRAHVHGIRVGPPTVDWPALVQRVRSFVSPVPSEVEGSLRARGVDVIAGAARFVGPRTVAVGDRTITAGAVVVASGSVPRPLGMPGAERLVTSDALFELEALPRSVVFVGGGVIAFEFAHVFARMGVAVTILEAAPRALAPLDEAIGARVVAMTRVLGVTVHEGVSVEAAERGPAGVRVRGADALSVDAELAVNTTGRVPAVADLDLAAAGLALDERGLPQVDGAGRSVTDPRVVFAGDALPGTPQLSPLATAEGRSAWDALAGHDAPGPDLGALPSAVYTVPPAAMVGLTAAQAERAGLAVTVEDHDTASWRSHRTYGDEVAFARVILEQGTGRIVGAHLLGRAADEVIHLFAFAARHGHGADEIRRFVTAYPTFHADVKHLL